jgi:hypothetical protein
MANAGTVNWELLGWPPGGTRSNARGARDKLGERRPHHKRTVQDETGLWHDGVSWPWRGEIKRRRGRCVLVAGFPKIACHVTIRMRIPVSFLPKSQQYVGCWKLSLWLEVSPMSKVRLCGQCAPLQYNQYAWKTFCIIKFCHIIHRFWIKCKY